MWYKKLKNFFSWHLLPEEPVKIQSFIEIVIFLFLVKGLFFLFEKWNEVPVRHIRIYSEAVNYKDAYDTDSMHYRPYRIIKFHIPATDKKELIKDHSEFKLEQGYFLYEEVRNNGKWGKVTKDDVPEFPFMCNLIGNSFKNKYYSQYDNRPLMWDSIEMNLPYYVSPFPKGKIVVNKPINGKYKANSFYNDAGINDTVNWRVFYGHDLGYVGKSNKIDANYGTKEITGWFGLCSLYDSFFGNETQMQLPKWGRFEDISQAYYDVEIQSISVDSIKLSFEFWGAVEFSKMTPEPDVTTMNYIEFNDIRKIKEIKRSGLKFYVEFKELAIRQQIRLFFVTALLSGLITILLVFAVLAVVKLNRHVGKFIVSYIKSKKERNKKANINKDNNNTIKDEDKSDRE